MIMKSNSCYSLASNNSTVETEQYKEGCEQRKAIEAKAEQILLLDPIAFVSWGPSEPLTVSFLSAHIGEEARQIRVVSVIAVKDTKGSNKLWIEPKDGAWRIHWEDQDVLAQDSPTSQVPLLCRV